MLLCIDVGNTNIKLGLFSGAEMRSRCELPPRYITRPCLALRLLSSA